MEAWHSSVGVWLLAPIAAVGLVAVVFARLSERSAFQPWCHAAFLVSLVLVGVATVVSVAFGPAATLASGSTLAVMAVAVVWELRPAPNVDTF
jgi:hypothetical protein